MNAEVHSALAEAIADEYRARTRCRATISAFGPVRPFVCIAEAEERHIAALVDLFQRRGFAVPPDVWQARARSAPSLRQACEHGATGELYNIAMYDCLLARPVPQDVRQVFARLQAASRDCYLPAFHHCLARLTVDTGVGDESFLAGLLVGAFASWTAIRRQ
jgi:hypothetical protein